MTIPARSRMEILCQAAALATIALAAGLCIRQAAALPVTQDEARTYLDYIDVPLVRGFMTAGGAQYGVYALIARWPVRLFGLSEFTLRLPSIAAGPAFLTACFLIARRLFGRGWLTLGTVAAPALNPFTLGYFSAGTGDGLGLALFGLGLCLVFRYVTED
jgi:predicted membrane-bound mannosyltransferase